MLNQSWKLTKETFSAWSEDRATRLAAALSYYAIFSIAPLLIIAIAVAGVVYGQQAAEGQLAEQMEETVGPQAAEALQSMIENAGQEGAGLIPTILGVAVLLWAATNIFAELRNSLNNIYGVQPDPNMGFWQTVRDRLLAFLMVMGVAIIFLGMLVGSTILSAMADTLPGWLNWVWPLADLALTFGVVALLVAAIYKVLPDVDLHWHQVWIGAIVTAILLAIGKFGLGMYLGRGAVAGAYGAAGSLVVLLLWIYYSSLIFFLGAEFIKVLARHRGQRIQPTEKAVKLRGEDYIHEGMPRQQQIDAAAKRKAEGRPAPEEREPWSDDEETPEKYAGTRPLRSRWLDESSPRRAVRDAEVNQGVASKLVPLAAGFAAGLVPSLFALTSPRKKARKKAPPKPPRRFAWGRLVEPGFATRKRLGPKGHVYHAGPVTVAIGERAAERAYKAAK